MEKALTWACIMCLLSESVKVATYSEVIPNIATGNPTIYIGSQHLPLHMCSIQIPLIVFARLTKNKDLRNSLLGIMYPLCMIGGITAIAMPSVFNTTISASEAFTHPIAYQTFLYHVVLLVLGIYIRLSGEVKMNRMTFVKSLLMYYTFVVISIYVNSALAAPVYENGVVKYLEFAPNFMFTSSKPVAFMGFDSKGTWALYMLSYLTCVVLLFALFFVKELCAKKEQES